MWAEDIVVIVRTQSINRFSDNVNIHWWCYIEPGIHVLSARSSSLKRYTMCICCVVWETPCVYVTAHRLHIDWILTRQNPRGERAESKEKVTWGRWNFEQIHAVNKIALLVVIQSMQFRKQFWCNSTNFTPQKQRTVMTCYDDGNGAVMMVMEQCSTYR